jgi:hypothetical protein
MKIRNKISYVIIITAIALNICLKEKTHKTDIDLNAISSIAMASEEENTEEEMPDIVPTGIIDWLGELIGF